MTNETEIGTDEARAALLKTPTLPRLLNRLRELVRAVDITLRKAKRQKMELYATTYLYIETACLRRRMDKTEVIDELVSEVGKSKPFWSIAWVRGRQIKTLKLDMDAVWPSALCQLPAGKETIQPQHLPKLAEALNAGKGPTDMMRMLSKMGYGRYPSKVPNWRRQQIRQSKKTWADWRDELQKLADQIAETTDGAIHLRLALTVNDAERPAVVVQVKKG